MMPAEMLQVLIAECAMKFAWFAKHGYTPTYWQALFHVMRKGGVLENGLCRYRHLVAGRRGGKTMCAAWEVAYYVLHPEEFHWDYHRKKEDRPLNVWVITKDFPTGHAALVWFRAVLTAAGLEHGVDYKENRGNRWFEFNNGSFVHFRSAEDPQSLRGAGNDILWFDEAAFIPTAEAYNVSRPSISDGNRIGMVITTTTPDGKNWLFDYFFQGPVLDDPRHGSVEYRSIDNEHFSEEEWLELLETYHPLMFKQEYMAAFDSMAGKELSGEWLKYYTDKDLDKYRENGVLTGLDIYIGVDPAISLADEADRFVISAVGVAKDRTEAFLLDQYADRIPFGTQLDTIQEWHIKHRPMLIGVEGVAYQQALVQQAMRLETFPPVFAVPAPGKKTVRILSMAPYFKIGRIKIRRDHKDFINEWLDYDSTKKNPKDDCLDSVEIALRTAGILLPPQSQTLDTPPPQYSLEELARLRAPKPLDEDAMGLDEHLGGDW
jgi:predicted phage terminase large subunit-like protein